MKEPGKRIFTLSSLEEWLLERDVPVFKGRIMFTPDNGKSLQNISFCYSLEDLTQFERVAIKRAFGPFKKGFGTALIRTKNNIKDVSGYIFCTLEGVYKCETICTPVSSRTTILEQEMTDEV